MARWVCSTGSQPLVPPVQENLVELLLMLDAARGASAGHLTVVMPHYAYARSDKKDASRISLGGRLVADLLVTAGATRVLTMELHARQVHGFFSAPVDHLTAIGILADHFRSQDLGDSVVVSPDFGNAKSATLLARLLGLPVAAVRIGFVVTTLGGGAGLVLYIWLWALVPTQTEAPVQPAATGVASAIFDAAGST